jgi:hypothetical protein
MKKFSNFLLLIGQKKRILLTTTYMHYFSYLQRKLLIAYDEE